MYIPDMSSFMWPLLVTPSAPYTPVVSSVPPPELATGAPSGGMSEEYENERRDKDETEGRAMR